jgi:hypothetical protein
LNHQLSARNARHRFIRLLLAQSPRSSISGLVPLASATTCSRKPSTGAAHHSPGQFCTGSPIDLKSNSASI